MCSERKAVCKACGGDLKLIDRFPTRPGFAVHKYWCEGCAVESRVEIDTRFG
jgi:hypothetical protein